MGIKLFKNLFGKGKESTKPKKNSKKKTTKKSSGPKKENKKKTVKKKIAAKKKAKKKPAKKVKTKKVKIKEVGVVTHYFGRISVGIIKLKTKLDLGDRIEIKGAHVDFSQPVKSMQINHKNVTSARKGAEVGVKVKKRIHLNDKVYKKTS
jgi:putative protease